MPDEQVIHILPLHQSRRLDNIPGILDNFMAIGRQLVDMDLKSGFDRFEHLVGLLIIGHTTLGGRLQSRRRNRSGQWSVLVLATTTNEIRGRDHIPYVDTGLFIYFDDWVYDRAQG